MIRNVRIQNFKSLSDVQLEFKALNLLMGMNGMGKSSLIQSLLVLRQSEAIHRGYLHLNGDLVSVGKGKDTMYQYSNKDKIGFVLEYHNREPLIWTFGYEPGSDVLHSNTKFESYEVLREYSIFSRNFQYLQAERIGPRSDYRISNKKVVEDQGLGEDGSLAVHYLNVYGSEKVQQKVLHHKRAKSRTLIHEVEAWMAEITPGIKLNTTEIPNTDKVLLDYQFETGLLYTNRFRPVNVGFGLSFVLPVVVALLSAQPERLIIIENPESHIHPRGQVELGRLIALAAETGAQLIIETHSDHIVNGIRVAVKEGKVDKDKVNFLYFERTTTEEAQYSIVSAIKVDEHGELSDYPQNFIDEWSNQLLKLM